MTTRESETTRQAKLLREQLRTRSFKDGGGTAWHPKYTYDWRSGVTKQDAIESCMKRLVNMVTSCK